MKKITTQSEIELIELELRRMIEHYGKEIDLEDIGLEVWERGLKGLEWGPLVGLKEQGFVGLEYFDLLEW